MDEYLKKVSGKSLDEYLEIVSGMTKLRSNENPKKELMLWENKSKKLQCFWAPFDYINPNAKIILVGITPGSVQMNIALNSAIDSSKAGHDKNSILLKAKRAASFSGGKTRNNLINILDRTGYQEALGISSSIELWEASHNHLVQFCSLLKYPIFKNGKNYNDEPSLEIPRLEEMIDEFIKDLEAFNPDAILIPLGDKVSSLITKLNNKKRIPQKLFIIDGKVVAPPHPSSANNESIKLLLEDIYPEEEAYEKQMYEAYVIDKSKKGEEPQDEISYKKARHKRWDSMHFVRRAYKLSV
jgi:hypothetical protein